MQRFFSTTFPYAFLKSIYNNPAALTCLVFLGPLPPTPWLELKHSVAPPLPLTPLRQSFSSPFSPFGLCPSSFLFSVRPNPKPQGKGRRIGQRRFGNLIWNLSLPLGLSSPFLVRRSNLRASDRDRIIRQCSSPFPARVHLVKDFRNFD